MVIRRWLCDTGLVKRASGGMHIDDTSRHYVTAGGERRATRCLLLRRSYRDENGKPRNETLANLSVLPDNAIAALRLALKGATLVDADSVFDVERSIPHGNVAAAHLMADKLGLRSLLGPPCEDRDIAYALDLVSRGAAEIQAVHGPLVECGRHHACCRSRGSRCDHR